LVLLDVGANSTLLVGRLLLITLAVLGVLNVRIEFALML
jgi:hypothetical protein